MMAASLHYMSVVLLLAYSQGKDQSIGIPPQSNNGTEMGNGSGVTPNTIMEAKETTQAASTTIGNSHQEQNITKKINNFLERKALTDIDIPEKNIKPLIDTKQLSVGNTGHKTLVIAEPDAIKKDLGGRCTTKMDCLSVNNTYCKDRFCVCNIGFIPSKHSLDKCVKVPSGLFDACEEEAQCEHTVSGSECQDGLCRCPFNYIFNLNRCWQKQMLGGICSVTEQCNSVASAVCTQGVCDCQPPLIPSPSNKCLDVAGKEYKSQCEEDIQCSLSYGDEARCSHGQCRCTNNYHYNGTTCIVDKKLGEPCSTDAQCQVFETNSEEASRICLDSICNCAIGFVSLPGEDICSKSSGQDRAVSTIWIIFIILAMFYLE